MTTTLLDPKTRLSEPDAPTAAHFIRKNDWATGYVEGLPVEALCGLFWVPSRDPNNLPVCGDCKRVRQEEIQAMGLG